MSPKISRAQGPSYPEGQEPEGYRPDAEVGFSATADAEVTRPGDDQERGVDENGQERPKPSSPADDHDQKRRQPVKKAPAEPPKGGK